MNELEFKRHLKDLVHGHHHPEEHDWNDGSAPSSTKKARSAAKPSTNRKRAKVSSKKK
jgi:hypothetical protein